MAVIARAVAAAADTAAHPHPVAMTTAFLRPPRPAPRRSVSSCCAPAAARRSTGPGSARTASRAPSRCSPRAGSTMRRRGGRACRSRTCRPRTTVSCCRRARRAPRSRCTCSTSSIIASTRRVWVSPWASRRRPGRSAAGCG
ncbi:hypothetical protein [Actinoplanes sp. SE50/110]|uniref:hypothetical protein n=1 Tax=unclassified Actinoplanes TaxID=2626549 RepID=UPI00350F1F69